MREIQLNQTTQVLPFLLVSSTDHITAVTGATPTVTLSKNGGAFASPSGAVSEVANGWYAVAGNATDANTLGPLVLHATATGADPLDIEFLVVGYSLLNAVPSGTSNCYSDLRAILGTAITETIAGWTAAAFKFLFNIQPTTSALTVASAIQTGDSFARLGAPTGASVSADIAAVEANALLAANIVSSGSIGNSALKTLIGTNATQSGDSFALANGTNGFNANAAAIAQANGGIAELLNAGYSVKWGPSFGGYTNGVLPGQGDWGTDTTFASQPLSVLNGIVQSGSVATWTFGAAVSDLPAGIFNSPFDVEITFAQKGSGAGTGQINLIIGSQTVATNQDYFGLDMQAGTISLNCDLRAAISYDGSHPNATGTNTLGVTYNTAAVNRARFSFNGTFGSWSLNNTLLFRGQTNGNITVPSALTLDIINSNTATTYEVLGIVVIAPVGSAFSQNGTNSMTTNAFTVNQVSGGGGNFSGNYNATLAFLDSTATIPIPNVIFTIPGAGTLQAFASGTQSFATNLGTLQVQAQPIGGYIFPSPYSVNITGNGTYQVLANTATIITAPTASSDVTVVFTLYKSTPAGRVVDSNKTITWEWSDQASLGQGILNELSASPVNSVTSDINGVVQFPAPKGSKIFTKGVMFTVPANAVSPYYVPEFNS